MGSLGWAGWPHVGRPPWARSARSTAGRQEGVGGRAGGQGGSRAGQVRRCLGTQTAINRRGRGGERACLRACVARGVTSRNPYQDSNGCHAWTCNLALDLGPSSCTSPVPAYTALQRVHLPPPPNPPPHTPPILLHTWFAQMIMRTVSRLITMALSLGVDRKCVVSRGGEIVAQKQVQQLDNRAFGVQGVQDTAAQQGPASRQGE